MNKLKWFLYLSGASLIVIPTSVVLMSEDVTFSATLSNTVISSAIILVILGKMITILEKRKVNKSFVPDIGAVIGLFIVLVLRLI
ncbi:histidine kinase [Alkalihalobacterium alkalinitrilicum]|uniref:histidine kinase n=1 Tax=Alkalihalobacterium alkalinitrilicum TaxID=427920 RepID=UPI00099574BF|nr:histidine kinase [Alkalihalobacterium alkalinitrilicum]